MKSSVYNTPVNSEMVLEVRTYMAEIIINSVTSIFEIVHQTFCYKHMLHLFHTCINANGLTFEQQMWYLQVMHCTLFCSKKDFTLLSELWINNVFVSLYHVRVKIPLIFSYVIMVTNNVFYLFSKFVHNPVYMPFDNIWCLSLNILHIMYYFFTEHC